MQRQSRNVDMERWFRALADKTRLRLINLLGEEEVCVCFLTEILQAPQPTISRHLSYLRRVGLVAARREGKWMHYRLVTPQNSYTASIFEDVRRWLKNDPEMQAERERLLRVCCAPVLPVRLQGAPKPAMVAKPA